MYFTAMERSSIRAVCAWRSDSSGMTRVSMTRHRIDVPEPKFYVDTFSDAKTLPSMTLPR